GGIRDRTVTGVQTCALPIWIVEGQVHGAAAHGIGAALLENCAYDSDGNMLAATFSDYTPITAANIPDLLCGHMETLSPFTLNGEIGRASCRKSGSEW